MKDAFTEFLTIHGDATFYTTAAPGNSGDLLLQAGLQRYLATQQVTVTTSPSQADIILMHGGGSIDDVWGTGLDHLLRLLCSHPQKAIVVAPSTIHFTETDLAAVLAPYTQPVHFFVREQYTYDRLQASGLPKNVTVQLAHDTAFLLQDTTWLAQQLRQSTDSYTLCALRTDCESAYSNLVLNHTPANLWEYGKRFLITQQQKQFLHTHVPEVQTADVVVWDDVSYRDFPTFLTTVRAAAEIYTDRLHVGILGALLGKPVHLFSTKYDKVRGVYEQSLRTYSNITLHAPPA